MSISNNELKKLQNASLYIGKEVKRICDKNNIKYSIIGGTLIGAIRDKGFIPWDDDIDFVMLRSQYNKFIRCCQTQLSNEFELQNWYTDKYFGHAFSRILLKNTEIITDTTQKVKYKRCIAIDIFPFDNIPDDKLKQNVQKIITYFCVKILVLKSNTSALVHWSPLQKFGCEFLRFFAKFFNRRCLIKICEKWIRRYAKINADYVTSMTGIYGYSKETVPKRIFMKYIELPFEDTTFMAIKDYNVYLSQVFGDYMQLPPIEKRYAHGPISIDYGPYKNKF